MQAFKTLPKYHYLIHMSRKLDSKWFDSIPYTATDQSILWFQFHDTEMLWSVWTGGGSSWLLLGGSAVLCLLLHFKNSTRPVVPLIVSPNPTNVAKTIDTTGCMCTCTNKTNKNLRDRKRSSVLFCSWEIKTLTNSKKMWEKQTIKPNWTVP